jgi:hypothetical protein
MAREPLFMAEAMISVFSTQPIQPTMQLEECYLFVCLFLAALLPNAGHGLLIHEVS